MWCVNCQKAVKTQNNVAKNCRKRAGFNSSLWERVSKGAIGLDKVEEYCAGFLRDMVQDTWL